MMVKKVAVLGAGNGGMTAAAELKEKGFEISLYELPQFAKNLQVMQEKGGILLQEQRSSCQRSILAIRPHHY